MAIGDGKNKILVPPRPSDPLPANLKAELQTLLFHQNKIKELSKILNGACESAGWPEKVQERALQLLRNDEVQTYQHLERMLMSEALGRDMVEEHERVWMEERAMKGAAPAEAKIEIRIPQSAIKAGTNIVRDTLEDSADIKREQIEEEEWKDWR